MFRKRVALLSTKKLFFARRQELFAIRNSICSGFTTVCLIFLPQYLCVEETERELSEIQ